MWLICIRYPWPCITDDEFIFVEFDIYLTSFWSILIGVLDEIVKDDTTDVDVGR